MRDRYVLFVVSATLLGVGCASSKNMEALESRLRVSEDRAIEAERALSEAQREIATLRDEVVLVREQAAGQGRVVSQGPRPTELAFVSLMTGGVDEDGSPGDEAVRAIVQPIADETGPIRAEGELVVELLDISAPADDRVCGSWRFEGQELRDLWSAGLFSTGYELTLAPQNRPLPDGALLLARFTTPEGDQLEATHTLKLRPDLSVAGGPRGPVRQVSASEANFGQHSERNIASMDEQLPDTLPVREPPRRAPVGPAGNPFAEFLQKPTRTSDSWTDTSIPVLR